MKRRRRLFTPWRILTMEAMAYGGEVVPPRSVLRAQAEAVKTYGDGTFRVGYYGRQDGLNCVWLVDESGAYFRTTDQRAIRDHFELIERSKETDVYGDDRPKLLPLASIA